MDPKTWNIIKTVAAYFSLLLNVLYISTWIYFTENSNGFEDAQQRFGNLWKIDHTLLIASAIILSIFSIIYFARTPGFLSKLFLFVQIIFAGWFIWSML